MLPALEAPCPGPAAPADPLGGMLRAAERPHRGISGGGPRRHPNAEANAANLANNHLTNFGPAGTNETQILLSKHGIGMSGLGLYEIRDIRGVKFAFLGFNGVGVRIDRAELKREIDLVRPKADVVVVSFHWGKEYELLPVAGPGIAPDNPKEIGHLAIDDGADLVIGNHPHWVQPVEIYNGHLITYAHGNFIFDQMWSQETREGMVGRYTFYGTRLVRVDYRPLVIDNYAQPRWLDETTGEGKAIIDRVAKASTQLAGGLAQRPPVRWATRRPRLRLIP